MRKIKINPNHSIVGKNKTEIYNMLIDALSEKLIKCGEYIKTKRK